MHGDLANLPAITENKNLKFIHIHIFLLTLSQFRSSNGKEEHFEQKGVVEIIFIGEFSQNFPRHDDDSNSTTSFDMYSP